MQRQPIDFSPHTPVLTRPDLFGDARYEEAIAAALYKEAVGRFDWICTHQTPPPPGALFMANPAPPPKWPPIYTYRAHLHTQRSVVSYGFKAVTYPGVRFQVLMPYHGPAFPRMPEPPVDDAELFDKNVPSQWLDPELTTGVFVSSSGVFWGDWSILLSFQRTEDPVQRPDDRARQFYRIVRIEGNPYNFLTRAFIHRWAIERIDTSPFRLMNPDLFKSIEDEMQFARWYYYSSLDGRFFHTADLRSTCEHSELVEPGLQNHNVKIHQGWSDEFGVWRSRCAALRDRHAIDRVDGPGARKWAQFIHEHLPISDEEKQEIQDILPI